ncbi:MAG: exopolysaccharide biosynthesis protein [Hyphomonadaceae bacterium]
MVTRLEAMRRFSRPRPPDAGREARRRDIGNLSDLLDRLAEHARTGATTTLRDVLAAIGHRSYGPLLLLIGIIAISPLTIVPGMTWLAAALTLVVAAQMLVGAHRIWLPKNALDARIEGATLERTIERARPWARRIDAILRPRLAFLTRPPLVSLVALAVIAAALVTFPLGLIPFAPLAPGAAIVFFGLGMTARDGLLIGLGLGALGLAGALFWPAFN